MQDLILIIIFIIALVGFIAIFFSKKSKNCGCSQNCCKTRHINKKDR